MNTSSATSKSRKQGVLKGVLAVAVLATAIPTFGASQASAASKEVDAFRQAATIEKVFLEKPTFSNLSNISPSAPLNPAQVGTVELLFGYQQAQTLDIANKSIQQYGVAVQKTYKSKADQQLIKDIMLQSETLRKTTDDFAYYLKLAWRNDFNFHKSKEYKSKYSTYVKDYTTLNASLKKFVRSADEPQAKMTAAANIPNMFNAMVFRLEDRHPEYSRSKDRQDLQAGLLAEHRTLALAKGFLNAAPKTAEQQKLLKSYSTFEATSQNMLKSMQANKWAFDFKLLPTYQKQRDDLVKTGKASLAKTPWK